MWAIHRRGAKSNAAEEWRKAVPHLVSQEDIESLRHQLSDILENFQVLNQVDTTDVPPTGHSVALVNVMRDDEAVTPLPKEATLSNAPLREDDYFRVKAVLD